DDAEEVGNERLVGTPTTHHRADGFFTRAIGLEDSTCGTMLDGEVLKSDRVRNRQVGAALVRYKHGRVPMVVARHSVSRVARNGRSTVAGGRSIGRVRQPFEAEVEVYEG